MEKSLFENEADQKSQVANADWVALNENELAAVGGGCAESTPY